MSGNRKGGIKAAKTNKEKYGDNFYKEIGRKGGSKSHPETRPFAANPELARIAGQKGGQTSKRGPSKARKEEKGVFKWFLGRKSK